MKKPWKKRWEECDPTRKGGIGLAVISLLIMGITWGAQSFCQNIYRHAYEVEGRIVDIQQKAIPAGEHSPPQTIFYPTFTFAAVGGTSHTILSRDGSTVPMFQNGDRITVYYEPTHPEDARIKHTPESVVFLISWYSVLVFLMLAGLVCIIFAEKINLIL